jgi:hypothetical protein
MDILTEDELQIVLRLEDKLQTVDAPRDIATLLLFDPAGMAPNAAKIVP